LFETVDTDDDGYVTAEELQTFMASNTPDEASLAIAKTYTANADNINKDGQLDEQGKVVCY